MFKNVQYLNTVKQVDFQITCPGEQVNILGKYQYLLLVWKT